MRYINNILPLLAPIALSADTGSDPSDSQEVTQGDDPQDDPQGVYFELEQQQQEEEEDGGGWGGVTEGEPGHTEGI